MNKFKVGDHVVGNTSANFVYNITKQGWKGVVTHVSADYFSAIKEGVPHDSPGFSGLYYENFDLVATNAQKIVITSDGTETLARLYDGDKVVKRAVAKCCPDDEFNFETGAKIAFRRLVQPVIDPVKAKPQYYTGKVVALENCNNGFGQIWTKGHIYKFDNGIATWDDGEKSLRYTSFDDFNQRNRYEFIEIAE